MSKLRFKFPAIETILAAAVLVATIYIFFKYRNMDT